MKKSNAALVFLIAAISFGFGKPEHSTVSVTKSGNTINIKAIPNEGLKITYDAPWSLKFKNVKGVELEKNSMKKDELNTSDASYNIKFSPASKDWNADFEFVSFVCTEDKTKCYREVHKGKINKQSETKTTKKQTI